MTRRILTIIPHYLGGGAETVTDSIVRNLRQHGHEFILVTQNVDEACIDRVSKVFNRVITVNIPLVHYSPSATAALAEVIAPLHADVLWLIGDELADIPTLKQALNKGGKIIYHLHSVPFFQIGLKDSFHGNPADRVAYVKWYLFKHLREKMFKSYRRRYMQRTAATAANVDAYVTLCKGYASELAGLYPAHAHKFMAIYNPVPPVSNAAPPAAKRKELLYVGRLTRADKRVDLLLRIFAKITDRHPDWTLKIVGDGPEHSNLEQLQAELNLSRIEFCGYTSNPGIYLESASILCMTSAIEGWGMALVEAMQHGVVPIAFNCSAGVSELLAGGRGILVPDNDLDRYAWHLSNLMDSSDLRNRILSTHHEFLTTLDVSNIMPQWLQLFK